MLFLIHADKPKVGEVVSSYWSDDKSEEARAAFDDFWKSEDVMLDIKDHTDKDSRGIICMMNIKGIKELLNQSKN